jgi:curli biogenesis system outer membrane secretion channel CsgG
MSRMVRLIFPLFLFAASCTAQLAASRPIEQAFIEKSVVPVRLVAVMDFDNRAVEQSAASIYSSQQDIGKGMSRLLAEKLQQGGHFQVVDRTAMQMLLAQQSFPVRDREDQAAVARLGKTLGLDAVILGSVIKFERKESRAAEDMGLSSRALSEARLKKSEWKAVCVIAARLVDTNTGETLASATSEGSAQRAGSSLLDKALMHSSRQMDAEGFNVHEPGFDRTLLGEAATKAITNLSSQLEAKVSELPNHLREISGVVADVSENTLTVNLGARSGLKTGDQLEIVRILRLVVDPKTGKPLRTITERIGDGTVTEMNMEFTTLAFSGDSPAKVGDIAQLRSARPTNHLARNAAGMNGPDEADSGTDSAADPAVNSNGHVFYAPH